MAAWLVGDSGLDFQLVQNGFISAFHSSQVLERALEWLDEHGYRTVAFDTGAWTSPSDMYEALASALSFPEHFGRNLDALSDCLSDLAEGEYGWNSADSGLVLVLEGVHRFFRREPAALALLEILEKTGQRAALFGNRVLILVRTDDPDARYGPIGGHDIAWNPTEFLRSARTA